MRVKLYAYRRNFIYKLVNPSFYIPPVTLADIDSIQIELTLLSHLMTTRVCVFICGWGGEDI